ncbi:MAG: NADH:ubiquinone oxidoreductase [Lentisphaerae bacterium RIFOXYB12_FULL_65_16]|nr:MAG: NADH:ubiquinone oxidoreductase [Lentisphaerae bacterium RIFOXYA12_64_32]OGV86988.1 MAG: NADH:ubiquinone oxidoreductase [Lentisphaerae bacterium RIFOXYB12_FULL_65_16]
MSNTNKSTVKQICVRHGKDRTRMMDIVRDVQSALGCVSSEAMDAIAQACGTHRVEVESVVSFYSFLGTKPKGKVVIRLCHGVIDRMHGSETVAAFEKELGIRMGETTPDGLFSLEWTACIGMCDQAPAALINDQAVTYLSTDKVKRIVEMLRADPDPKRLVRTYGDGNNAHELVHSMVHNNIRRRGAVIFGAYERGSALRKALAMTPQEVIRAVKTASLRGRGGAGFPTGMKWDFTRAAQGEQRYVLCNADEGEPGTFKDRVLLTECAEQLIEGMTIAGYAIGAAEGILYLRAEYAYLKAFVEAVVAQRRKDGLLGASVCGKAGVIFDIRVQMGAGAYVCGEETALISSCEGLRGDPKTRPPFPASKGYLGCPTAVNNVETFCCVPPILEHGPGWFAQMGSSGSKGTKLLTVSGDCSMPGVYEVDFGITLRDVLKMVGSENAKAVQVGGPSGQMVGPEKFDRKVCYDHLATGGSVMVFGPERDVLAIAAQFLEFFMDEGCGYCTPCRVGNVLLKERLDRILAGQGAPTDMAYLQELGEVVKMGSRCGLGQTSPNPVLTTLASFRGEYERRCQPAHSRHVFLPGFDIRKALADSESIAGRHSVVYSE